MYFGKIVKARRKELRMTQDDLSKLTEISKFKIVQIEKGGEVLFSELTTIGKAIYLTTVSDWLDAGTRLGIR